MPESDRHSLVGLFSLRARLSSKTDSVRPTLSKMAADQRKMAHAIFFNAVIPEIRVGIAPYLEHVDVSTETVGVRMM